MTPRPVVAVISDDILLVQQLAHELGEGFELIARPGTREMQEVMRGVTPHVLLVDARDVNDGGHAIDQFLATSVEHADNLSSFMLCLGECPEPLERRLACSQIERVEASEQMTSVAKRIAECKTVPKSVESLSLASSGFENDDSFAEVVLEGVTRRFETNSAQLKNMLEDLAVAAEHDVTILLVGETGSGKTFLSRLIHEASPRRNEPFLHVACGALPRELIESELFGHAKGSFTSAHANKEGKFVAARRGTVLLDEIDVLGPEQQVKLLRVIETGEFEPVGSNETHRSAARLVVASNLDLQPLVDQGRFRPDLYYRLNMLKFEIPPLRRRRMDIVPLAKLFLRKFQQKHGIQIARIDDSLLEALVGYPWPGNVRELENVIQRAVIYCRDGVLTAKQLPVHIVAGAAGPTNDPSVRLEGHSPSGTQSLGRQIALTEKEIIEQALFQNNYSKTKTAKALGISRVTLYNKMKKFEMTK
ncbi:MAG: sigma-54-dependent Fis family transcriptional regulator [Planctomycetaceae bacterium]|nr:sigma-54-dependent Fis family transcriptional regulator [Planctomycetaceae bacterium]